MAFDEFIAGLRERELTGKWFGFTEHNNILKDKELNEFASTMHSLRKEERQQYVSAIGQSYAHVVGHLFRVMFTGEVQRAVVLEHTQQTQMFRLEALRMKAQSDPNGILQKMKDHTDFLTNL